RLFRLGRADAALALRTCTSEVLLHRSAAADLLIIGARRRHGHFSLHLGRVGHTLLHHADCPVAIVPRTGPTMKTTTPPSARSYSPG
ncbi:universal stress protein, partial [Streptomyces afghaniensis]|uniref:universal stress protein n=1 Tax=Streptomyces afghaniensis TaxID=66865 RepID=UPI00056470FB